MSEFDFASMVTAAKDSGALAEAPPDGHYVLKLSAVNDGKTKAGDPRFGLRWEVASGPEQGKAFWDNLNFIASKPRALGVTFTILERMGVPRDFFSTNPSPEAVKERLLEIGHIEADMRMKTNGDFPNYNLRNIKHLGDVDPSLPSPSAAPAAATAPGGRSF